MKHHEREYFISKVRSGFYPIDMFNKVGKIITPTVEQEFIINQTYQDCYEKNVNSGINTYEEMLEYSIQNGLWTEKDQEQLDSLIKKVEDFKVAIYEFLYKPKEKFHTESLLSLANNEIARLQSKKDQFFSYTCEGLAQVEKFYKYLSLCTYVDGQIYDFSDHSMEFVSGLYYSQILSEKKVRELARNEPWRTLWVLRESNEFSLFANQNTELSIDQKNLLVWSKMYDNVQESMDAPPKEVIEDDNMLDGWFIVQDRKRESEKANKDLDSKLNEKVSNSQEIMLMASNKAEAKKINSLNTTSSQVVKQKRNQLIRQKGAASQLDFQDEQVKLQQQSNEQFKQRFRR